MTAVPAVAARPTAGPVPRVLVVVCDSWGVGDAPDAAAYGDEGSNTLGNTAHAVGGLDIPTLEALGLGLLTDIEGVAPRAETGTAHGWAVERSAGKDTTTGHWEMMGIRLDEPFPLYPHGFPPEIVEPFERAIGRGILGQRARIGNRDHRRGSARSTSPPASRSSTRAATPCSRSRATSVWCRSSSCTSGAASRVSCSSGPHRVGRVIARPFEGEPGAFVPEPGAPGLRGAAARPDRARCARGSRRVRVRRRQDRRTSSTDAASPRPRTPTPTTTASMSPSSTYAGPGRPSCSRIWSISIPSTDIETIQRATRTRSRRSIADSPSWWGPSTGASC